MNQKFRAEFSSLQSFKFFTEDQLNGIDAKLAKNMQDIEQFRIAMLDQKEKLSKFQDTNMGLGTNLSSIT